MATDQPVSIFHRGSVSPHTSPRVSPRSSPRTSPRLSPRRITLKSAGQQRVLNESSTSTTPYFHGFQEPQWLAQILAELMRKDSELLNLLRANRAQHISKVFAQQVERLDEKQALITSYREFLDMVVSLFARSVFLVNPELVTEVHDPQRIVKVLSSKKCPRLSIFCRVVIEPALIADSRPESISTEEHNGIPVNQLARFCDVAVLKFLDGVNEHTRPHAVLWAIDYISDLLRTLLCSIASHNSRGWYGAPSTRQKKTVSVNVPPPFIQPPPPTVVVVSSPPPAQTDPETDPDTGQSRVQSGAASPFQFPPRFQDEPPHHSPHLIRNLNSLPELDSYRSENMDNSTGSAEEKKTSPVDPAGSPNWSASNSPILSSPRTRRALDENWSPEVGGLGMLGSGLRPRSPRLADIKIDKPQSIPEEEEEGGRGETTREKGLGERRTRGEEKGKTTSQDSSDEDEGEGESEGEEVKSKTGAALTISSSSDFIKSELKSFMNAEGRISLLAILKAIARLPQSDDIWTERFGMNCFQLIQLCMDLGLTQTTKTGEQSSSQKRRRFQKQENLAFHAHGQEQPCRVHSKYIVHYAVHALIQCATNLLVGCSHDQQQTCWLAYKRVFTQNNLIHPRLLRHLNRIHCHTPQEFQRVMMHFAITAPLRKVLHFLHVVLEYCQLTPNDKVDSLLLSIVSSVLRTLVDRLAQLDLSKPSLQEGLIFDVCLFFRYAQALFSFNTQLDSYRHFHMYINRVALSVILPEQETKSSHADFHPFPAILEESETLTHDSPPATPQPSPGFATRGNFFSQSLPRRLRQKTASEEKPRPRSSIQSDHVVVSKSPKVARRGPFTKQHSIHERDDSILTMQASGSEVCMDEWRRLKLNVLRHRIQRLVVLMDLSEPGSIPDPGMLASLIDLSDGTLVVARAMVLLECALFVHNLRKKEITTHWMEHRQEGANRASILFKKWAVAVAEKLRIVELRERDMIQRLRMRGGGVNSQVIVLPEEPVLPEAPVDQEKQKTTEGGSAQFRTVSYGVKMCACILLHEITHYLRENVTTASLSFGTPRVSITDLDHRRPSIVSTTSTDTEAVGTPTSGAMQHSLDSKMLSAQRQRLRQLSADSRSSSLEEEGVHGVHMPSVDEGSFEDSTQQEGLHRKVSVYLRVNSALEKRDGLASKGRLSSGLKQTVNVRSSAAENVLMAPKRRSSVSASVGRRHVSFYEKRNSNVPVVKERPAAVTVGTLRPVPGRKSTVKTSQSFQENQDSISPSESLHRPTLQPQGSTASQKTQNLGAQIQSGISRLARRAFRGKLHRKTPSSTSPRKSSLSNTNLLQRKRPQRLSTAVLGPGMEDDRHYFPWLDIIEHLVVVDALNPEAHTRHAQTCKELMTALNHVYALKDTRGEVKRSDVQNTRHTLNQMFSSSWEPFMHRRERSGLEHARGSHLRHTGRAKHMHSLSMVMSQSAASSISSSQSMASLDFSQIRRRAFLLPCSYQGTAIELFLEQDSPSPETKINTNFNSARKSYVQRSFAGLMHAPFSLLVYAAPILLPSTFSSLKDVAWEMILDRNQELAEAAGQFFLLAAAKEGDAGMREFFARTVEKADAVQQREAVLRFTTLWKCRYKVWPAVGERGQKRFNASRETEERQDQQTIGYSLPANLLGSAGRDVPVAPWTAVSLCIHNDCQSNPDKCYRATRLAPLKHCKEVSEAVEGFAVSGISIPLEADAKPTSVFAGVGSEDNAGNININQWEAVEPTLFPPSLLPLITFVIFSLTPHSSPHSTKPSPPSLNKSELAYQAIRECMVEDPRLLFRPLLNRFNKLYQDISDRNNQCPQTVFMKSLKDTLHPLHTILQSFPVLPPKAAHFLFNSFVGIITRHTDQPCTFSPEIIQSVLLLLTMVIPSVRGLDLKVLKSTLKKESSYTTILTTARIRGTEKVTIIDETSTSGIAHDQSIDADDTFGQVIARFKGTQLSHDLLQNFYLVDQSKDLPVLSTQVVKDHYSMLTDKKHPTFVLREAERGSGREVWSWGDQLNQLFVHKMSEVLRVAMIHKLLATGPEIEKGSHDVYNKFAQPNYRFLHQELVALTSFPRQALTSILYEAGPSTLAHHHLRSSDNMLMGTWVKFVLELFIRAKPEYDWGNSLVLFLNVINGALLLYSEDLAILRQCLAALIVVTSKFIHVFRRHGYELVIPTLVQVYASHMNNRLITDALKFVWGQFYLLNLDSNVFLLQAIAATATLLSDDAAKLSNVSGTPLHSSLHSQPVVIPNNNGRAVFLLLKSLDSETAPPDHLHIMSLYPVELQLSSHWQPLSVQTIFYLCITVATWDPEAVRGMQILVFLDRLIPMFLNAISVPRTSPFVLESMRSLVKGCDAITKPLSWKGEFLRRETQRTDTQQNLDTVGVATDTEPSLPPPHQPQPPPRERKTSAVSKIYRRIVNPSKTTEVSKGSAYFPQSALDKATSILPPIGHQEYIGEFRRRLQASNQRVLQLSRESLLSLSSKLVLHEVTQLRERTEPGSRVVVRIDSQTTSYLTAIAVQLLKLGGSNEVTLTSQGLSCFMESLLPNIEWTDAHFGSFHNIISRLVKLFRTLCRIRIILAWDGLTTFLRGVTQCIKTSPQLAAHEQIFMKLKMLLEVILSTPSQGGGGGQEGSPSQGRGGKKRQLLHFAPASFNQVIVSLVSQLLVTTKDAPNPRLQYHFSDLLSQRLVIRDTIVPKILLPLCIHLGLREDLKSLPREDLSFLLQLLEKRVDNILKLCHPPFHPSHFMDPTRSDIPVDMFCRAIKVFCCAFSNSFTLHDWSRVAQWIMSLSLRKLDWSHPGPSQSVLELRAEGGIERSASTSTVLTSPSNRSSRSSTVLSQHNFDAYHAFYKALLVQVYEGLLSVYHTPLFFFLWPLLGQLETQLCEAEKCVKMENPVQLQDFRNLIDKCQSLKRQGLLAHTTRCRNALLMSYQDEMKTPTSNNRFKRASTTVDRNRHQQRPMRRRLSYQQSLPSIGEEEAKVSTEASETQKKGRKRSEFRPNFLRFSSPPPEETRGMRQGMVLKGENLKRRPVRGSADEVSVKGRSGSLSSSDGITPVQKPPQSASNLLLKKSAPRKQSNPVLPSPLASPPTESSPRTKRRLRKPQKSQLADVSARNPPLAQLKDDSKFTSSEFQADVEDFDAVSPLSVESVEDRLPESSTVAVNEAAIRSELETGEHAPGALTIQAEVHFDAQERRESTGKGVKMTSKTSSDSLIPPPPVAAHSPSRSPSPLHVTSPSVQTSSVPSPSSSPTPHLATVSSTTLEETSYSQDLGRSSDLLIPRERTNSSPPAGDEDDSPLHDSSPCDTETDTDNLLPHQWSNASGSLPRSKALSPNSPTTTIRRLSFERKRLSFEQMKSFSFEKKQGNKGTKTSSTASFFGKKYGSNEDNC